MDIIGELILSLIGAPFRWIIFMGSKSWEEIFDDPQNYNAIVGLIIVLITILSIVYIKTPV